MYDHRTSRFTGRISGLRLRAAPRCGISGPARFTFRINLLRRLRLHHLRPTSMWLSCPYVPRRRTLSEVADDYGEDFGLALAGRIEHDYGELCIVLA
jgi:hypothetical protein